MKTLIYHYYIDSALIDYYINIFKNSNDSKTYYKYYFKHKIFIEFLRKF